MSGSNKTGCKPICDYAIIGDCRSAALLAPVPDSSEIDWPALGDLSKIRPFTDTIHYVLPKLLFVTISFHGSIRSGARASAGERASVADEIPRGVADSTMSHPDGKCRGCERRAKVHFSKTSRTATVIRKSRPTTDRSATGPHFSPPSGKN